MPLTTLSIKGVGVPRFFYGTAWKELHTQRLVELAIEQGFRAIDTANQRRHYDEVAVGEGIAVMIARGKVARKDLFLQTKFTFQRGQDHRLPYDPVAPIATQVKQSLTSSLEHLGVENIDSFLLHGPMHQTGWTAADWEAWRAMEDMYDSGRILLLGVSNVTIGQLQDLFRESRVRPTFVQNRCYAARGWDRHVRQFCNGNGMVYQGFSLLTANREAMSRPELVRIAKRYGRFVSQIVFRFAIDVGIVPLTGTSDVGHMRADLEAFDFSLEPEEIEQIDGLFVA